MRSLPETSTNNGDSPVNTCPTGPAQAAHSRFVQRIRRRSAHGGQFDIWSFGADGQEGGEGNDADIGNWQG